jgi:hypothetical protein
MIHKRVVAKFASRHVAHQQLVLRVFIDQPLDGGLGTQRRTRQATVDNNLCRVFTVPVYLHLRARLLADLLQVCAALTCTIIL